MIIKREMQARSVLAECAEAYSRMAGSVLDVFERLADSGTPLRSGTQVRFGWSLLRLGEDGDGLRVTEPAFLRWPEQYWTPTIDITLNVLAAQTRLLQRLAVDGEDAFFDQSIIAAHGALAEPDVFLRHASSVSPEDSGWLLGTTADPEALAREDQLEAVSIASLVARRPALLQALALPSEFIVLFSGDSVEQIFDAAGRARLAADS
jgi:hypothetical protein